MDVIASHVGGPWLYVFENDGIGQMVSTTLVQSFNGPAHVIASDVSGDGVPDLITANTNNGSTNVFISQVDQVGCSNCFGDLNQNGAVDVLDIIALIENWGICNGCCPGDLSGNGVVDVLDMLEVIAAWGVCSPPLRSMDEPQEVNPANSGCPSPRTL